MKNGSVCLHKIKLFKPLHWIRPGNRKPAQPLYLKLNWDKALNYSVRLHAQLFSDYSHMILNRTAAIVRVYMLVRKSNYWQKHVVPHYDRWHCTHFRRRPSTSASCPWEQNLEPAQNTNLREHIHTCLCRCFNLTMRNLIRSNFSQTKVYTCILKIRS